MLIITLNIADEANETNVNWNKNKIPKFTIKNNWWSPASVNSTLCLQYDFSETDMWTVSS